MNLTVFLIAFLMLVQPACATEVIRAEQQAPLAASPLAPPPDDNGPMQDDEPLDDMLYRPLHVFGQNNNPSPLQTLLLAVPASMLSEKERISLGSSILGLPFQHPYRLYLNGLLIYEGGRAAGLQKTPDLEWIRINSEDLISPVALYGGRSAIGGVHDQTYAERPVLPPSGPGKKEYILLACAAIAGLIVGRRLYRTIKTYLRGGRVYRKRRYSPGVGV